jgi:hypothetical protein
MRFRGTDPSLLDPRRGWTRCDVWTIPSTSPLPSPPRRGRIVWPRFGKRWRFRIQRLRSLAGASEVPRFHEINGVRTNSLAPKVACISRNSPTTTSQTHKRIRSLGFAMQNKAVNNKLIVAKSTSEKLRLLPLRILDAKRHLPTFPLIAYNCSF